VPKQCTARELKVSEVDVGNYNSQQRSRQRPTARGMTNVPGRSRPTRFQAKVYQTREDLNKEVVEEDASKKELVHATLSLRVI
jgi:hypothetical protein